MELVIVGKAKRICAVLLAAVLFAGMSAAAFAKDTPGGVGFKRNKAGEVMANNDSYSIGTLAPGEVYDNQRQDAVFLVYYDRKGRHHKALTRSLVDRWDVEVHASYNDRYIDAAGIAYDKNGAAYLRIEMVDELVGVAAKPWYVRFRMEMDGHTATTITLEGELENDSQEIYEDYDYIDMVGSPVIYANDSVSNVELLLDYDILIHTRLVAGREYYAQASDDVTERDERLLSRYPELLSVYTLYTQNLPASSQVEFDVYDRLYVYDADLRFLGRTSAKLPLAEKYYVAAEPLGSYQDSYGDYDERDGNVTVSESSSDREVRLYFEKYFRNQIRVGNPVDISGMNIDSLVFYSYNASTNKYATISSPGYRVEGDALTYLKNVSGYLVVSEGKLARR